MVRRLALFVLVTALLVAVAVWLADRPGSVTIHWQGWRLDTSVPVLVLLVLAAVALVELALRVTRGVLGAPGRWLERRRAKRTRQGYAALSDGLAAIAIGDSKRAKKLAKRAENLLEDQSLTGLLTAQAAELSGDQSEAAKRFDAMLARPETALLGLKGLLALALKRGDSVAALDFAQRAWALNPGADGLAVTLFELQARAGLWGEAEATLAQARRSGAMDRAQLARAEALALLERSKLVEASGDLLGAVKLAERAHKAEPAFVPTAVQASRLFHRLGKERKANAVIAATWRVNAHADLVEASIDLAPAETPLQRVKRLEALIRANPEAPEGHVALARAALAAKLWGQARTHLEKAVELRPSRAAYELLAAVERDERKDEPAALAWQAKAQTAPAEATWTCRACGKNTETYAAACPHCGTIDGLN